MVRISLAVITCDTGMTSYHSVRQALGAFVAGRLTTPAFATIVAPFRWSEHVQSDPRERDLLNIAELRLAELSNGHRTVAEVRALLRPFAETFELVVGSVEISAILGGHSGPARRLLLDFTDPLFQTVLGSPPEVALEYVPAHQQAHGSNASRRSVVQPSVQL